MEYKDTNAAEVSLEEKKLSIVRSSSWKAINSIGIRAMVKRCIIQ
ncbi:hypothetical protein Cyrtocomes_01096 [Candidatus Cyrtobacter comes]|uniref:Uncharacterized protein n=1 Tax=Candidatus Cyrtobacter comes TaxID=675776 RepID=A0ABU5L998_9RICK|nr:hypothetical protein [Candidatus Cyrtobacter comes]